MSVLVKTPPQPFLGSILIRTLLVWAILRATIASLQVWGVDIDVHPAMSVGIAAAVILVVTLDLYRRNEVTFLRALGVGFTGMVIPAALFCGALEAALLLLA